MVDFPLLCSFIGVYFCWVPTFRWNVFHLQNLGNSWGGISWGRVVSDRAAPEKQVLSVKGWEGWWKNPRVGREEDCGFRFQPLVFSSPLVFNPSGASSWLQIGLWFQVYMTFFFFKIWFIDQFAELHLMSNIMTTKKEHANTHTHRALIKSSVKPICNIFWYKTSKFGNLVGLFKCSYSPF